MRHEDLLNPFAQRVWTRLRAEYPAWEIYFDTTDNDNLEVAIPAPPGSHAGHLVIFTTSDKDLWLRLSPPYTSYRVDDEDEMLSIVKQLLAEQLTLIVITKGGEWAETTLIRPGQEPQLDPGQVARVLSWFGTHDRTISTET
jgi:hypothetical protein